jgi:hypothetical protein
MTDVTNGIIGQAGVVDAKQKGVLTTADFDMFPRFETMWTYYKDFTAIPDPVPAATLTGLERNNIKGAYYTTNQWYNVEYPMVKIDMTPSKTVAADKRYRYYPGKVLNWSVNQFNEMAKNYNSLVATYNTDKTVYETYLTALKEANTAAAASPTAKAAEVTPVP